MMDDYNDVGDNDAMISFDDDDDEMADLFSFGTASSPSNTAGATNTAISSSSSAHHVQQPHIQMDYTAVMESVMPLPKRQPQNGYGDDDDDGSSSSASEDSLIELLEQNKDEITIIDAASVKKKKMNKNDNEDPSHGKKETNKKSDGENNPTTIGSGGGENEKDDDDDSEEKKMMDEKDMQEVLDWLENDADFEQELLFVDPPKPPTLEETMRLNKEKLQAAAARNDATSSSETSPSSPAPPEFDTLEQAVKSPKSQMSQIRCLLQKENFSIASTVRPHLWAKVVCDGKTLEEVLQSSVADSFQHWEQEDYNPSPQQQQQQQQQQSQKTTAAATTQNQIKQLEWIQRESSTLAVQRISTVLKSDKELCQRALAAVLTNYYITIAHKNSHMGDDDDEVKKTDDNSDQQQKQQQRKKDDDDDNDNDRADEVMMDTLLPPVACVLLSAGIPKVGVAVMLNKIVPHYMPILALTTKERIHAAATLHQQFYLLACYHLPLLTLHLDRYFPDWYLWPSDGFIPKSYLISHLAGECGKKAEIHPRGLLCLWDLILTSNNNSLRYFLVLSILESHSDQLLLLTGNDLKDELQRVMTFQDYSTEDGNFAIEATEDKSTHAQIGWIHDWIEKAQTLWENTPKSVVHMLKHLEDEAVNDALTKRQRDAEERLRLKLEAQARAHEEAAKAEQERKEDAARLRLTRARLVAFYRQYNPGKETNIDKIMKTYEGRYDVLDAKLRQKYGVGFNPALRPKTAQPLFTVRRVQQPNDEKKKQRKEKESTEEKTKKPRDMAIQIQPGELIPSICWSKEANKAHMDKLRLRKQSSKLAQPEEMKLPLRYYLVDCRPGDSVLDQGRFPTSVSLSPEMFMDVDKMKEMEDMFEGLRGTVHICIMGEGYSALPALYGHKITRGLLEFIKGDEARVMNCVLFFLKKGYPFVSVLDGGFAAAHAFLWREGSKVHLRAQNVLTDYNPEVSIFGQFEKNNNASGREKAQRTLQNIFDSGMTALTKNTMRFESLASEAGGASGIGGNEQGQNAKGGKTNVVSRFWGQSDGTKREDTAKSDPDSSRTNAAAQAASFLNPFARKGPGQEVEQEKLQASDGSLVVESMDSDKDPEESADNETGDGARATESVQQQKPQPQQPRDIPSSDHPKSNRFSGLGAALNSSLKVSGAKAGSGTKAPLSNPLHRNPFSRFGMGNSNQSANKKSEGVGVAGMTNKFAVGVGGLSQFRKNTVARMRGGAAGSGGLSFNNIDANEKATAVSQQEVGQISEQETISLDQSSPAIASSIDTADGNNDVQATTESLDEAVDAQGVKSVEDSPAIAASGSATSDEEHEGSQQKAQIAQV